MNSSFTLAELDVKSPNIICIVQKRTYNYSNLNECVYINIQCIVCVKMTYCDLEIVDCFCKHIQGIVCA